MDEFIDIDGHKVDPKKVDRFYNGSDGTRVTDEQWDEDKRRAIEFADVDPMSLPFTSLMPPIDITGEED